MSHSNLVPRLLTGALLTLVSSVLPAALPDHPEKDGDVLYTADVHDATMDVHDSTSAPKTLFRAQELLEVTTDEGLLLSHFDGTSWIVDWQALHPGDPGYGTACRADLHPTLGLTIYDCAGNRIWSVLEGQPRSFVTNWHLRFQDGEMRLFDMDEAQLTWTSSEEDLIRAQELPTWYIKEIWDHQGWGYTDSLTSEQVQTFVDKFSDRSRDPHADFHRVLHWLDRAKGVPERTRNRFFRAMSCMDQSSVQNCALEKKQDVAEYFRQSYEIATTWMKLADKITALLKAGDSDGMPDELMQAVADNVADENVRERLLSILAPDRQRGLAAKKPATDEIAYGKRFHHGGLATLMGKTDRWIKTDVGFKINLNFAELWDALIGSPLPLYSQLWTTITAQYEYTWPRYHPDGVEPYTGAPTAVTSHRFKVSSFSGLAWDADIKKFLPDGSGYKGWLPRAIPEYTAVDVGPFGGAQWVVTVTQNLNTGAKQKERTLGIGGGLVKDWILDAKKAGRSFVGAMIRGLGSLADSADTIASNSNYIEDMDIAGQATVTKNTITAMSNGMKELYADALANRNVEIGTVVNDALEPASAAVDVNFEPLWGPGGAIGAVDSLQSSVTMDGKTYEGLTSMEMAALKRAELQRINPTNTFAHVLRTVEYDKYGTQRLDYGFLKRFIRNASASWALEIPMSLGGIVSHSFKLDEMTEWEIAAVHAVPFVGGGAFAGLTSWVLYSYTNIPYVSEMVVASEAFAANVGFVSFATAFAEIAFDETKVESVYSGFASVGFDIKINLDASYSVQQQIQGFMGEVISGKKSELLELDGYFHATMLLGDSGFDVAQSIVSRRLTPAVFTENAQLYEPHVPEGDNIGDRPVQVTAMQSFAGPDTAVVRVHPEETEIHNTELSVRIDEEKTGDSETGHTFESLGLLSHPVGDIFDSSGKLVGEAGRLTMSQGSAGGYTQLSYQNRFEEPIVVASVSSSFDDTPVHVRLSEVGDKSALVQLEQWVGYGSQYSGIHGQETVDYFVFERGTHMLPNGLALVAGSVNQVPCGNRGSGHDFVGVNLSNRVEFSSSPSEPPIVLSQIQTDGPYPRTARLRNVGPGSFEVVSQGAEAASDCDGSAVDSVGYIAAGVYERMPQAGRASFASAAQSSTILGGVAERAIDGNPNGSWNQNSVTHTEHGGSTHWWEGDLGQSSPLSRINVFNRTDCCAQRLRDFYVFVGDRSVSAFLESGDLQGAKNAANDWTYMPGRVAAEYPFVWNPARQTTGRYVTVYKQDVSALSLAEVAVYGPQATTGAAPPAANFSGHYFVSARQKSTAAGGSAVRAIDGNTSGDYFAGSVTHTGAHEQTWWQGDLGSDKTVGALRIHNRTDCCSERLKGFRVYLSRNSMVNPDGITDLAYVEQMHEDGEIMKFEPGEAPASNPWQWLPAYEEGGREARYVMVIMDRPSGEKGVLSLAEVQAYVSPNDMTEAQLAPPPPEETTPPLVIDDSLPAGATVHGNDGGMGWYAGSAFAASGERYRRSLYQEGIHQHYVLGLDKELNRGDMVSTYVFISNPPFAPSGIQLQLHDSETGWGHRVHWGEVSYSPSTRIGPMPLPRRQWVKLSVPISAFGLSSSDKITGIAWTANSGVVYWDRTVIGPYSDLEPLFVLDESLPDGATVRQVYQSGSGMNWSLFGRTGVSGSRYHLSPDYPGPHQHVLEDFSVGPVSPEDRYTTHVKVDPYATPSGIQIQLKLDGIWRRAHWGEPAWGNSSTSRYMGPVPEAGKWVEISAELGDFVSSVEPISGDATLSGIAWSLSDGQASWDGDRVEPAAGGYPIVDVDDEFPAGATMRPVGPDWQWITALPGPKSGYLYHVSPLASGGHQAVMEDFSVAGLEPEDTLTQYVWIDPENPPTAVQLQALLGGVWRRVHWGDDPAWGNSKKMGPLPDASGWVRLRAELDEFTSSSGEISSASSLSGFAWSLKDGQAWWDRMEINPN